MNLPTEQKGFILPGAIVFSLILIILGVSFLQYTSSFTSILRKDYYSSLAKKASESGVKIAAKCFQTTIKDTDSWPADSILTPNKDCSFNNIPGASQYVSEDKNGSSVLRTTYSVQKPEITDQLITFTAVGTTELFSSPASSNPAFSRTEISKLQVPATDKYSDIKAAEGLAVTDVSVGLRHTCAIANMSPYCWGANLGRQAGAVGSTSDRTSPVKLNDPSNFIDDNNFANELVHSISAAPNQTCAITTTGQLYCWGMNAPFGTVGVGYKIIPSEIQPTRIVTGSVAGSYPSQVIGGVSSSQILGLDGQQYICSIFNGKVACVGQNFFAQAGRIHYARTINGLSFRKIVAPTAKFTMWAFGTGLIDFAAGYDPDEYETVFGYDKSAELAEESQVGKFNATDMAAGQTNACTNENGRIFCWGEQSMPWVMSQNGWTGSFQGLPIITIGPLTLWKGNVVYHKGFKDLPGSSLQGKMAYSPTAVHTSLCALAEGQAHCWGRSLWNRGLLNFIEILFGFLPIFDNPATPIERGWTEGRDVSSISRAGSRSYACLLASGIPYCWGEMPGAPTQNRPVKLDTPGFVNKVDGGDEHTCLLINGSSYCFGKNHSGQIGDGTRGNNRSTLTKTHDIGIEEDTHAATSIDSGDNHSCSIINGDIFCWGANEYGQLGTDDTSLKLRPTRIDQKNIPVQKSATAVSAGKRHSCAVIEGDVYCWGANEYGQLGNNSTINSNTPVKVTFPTGSGHASATSVSANGDHTCAVVNGRAWCWGRNQHGQLGTGNTVDYRTPTQISVANSGVQRHITSIAAGDNFTCAIGAERTWCWGANDRGQIGRGSIGGANQLTAREVSIGSSAHNGLGYASKKLAVGDRFACTIVNGMNYCWGDNTYGQLGRGNTSHSGSPARVAGAISSSASFEISTGSDHACSITNGKTYCWGRNNDGQIGNGSTATAVTSPVLTHVDDAVLNTNHPYRLASGRTHTCSIANGKIACWGSGSHGQLGGNDTSSSLIPKWTHNRYAIGGLVYDWDRAMAY